MSYKEWKREAKENIRLLPKYGDKPKTKEQLASDSQLIDEYIKQEGSRRNASEVLIKLGFNYLYRGDVRTAMYRFNQAWLLDPENENVFWGWGAIYFTFNDTIKALEQYDEGLSKNPENSNILTDKATVFMNRYHESKDTASLSSAISLFSKSYLIDSLNQNTSYKLSVAYFLTKDCDNALRFYDICEKLGGKPIQKEYAVALESTCKK
ncbi:tetratricopeptide repeat protein [Dyadobacter pollutisoli]|uniref:Tetratricopeptide repeat protein n=1 Tax=Dyadobacter pollutisoli TaxID=2910158 RepID=A0A9E8NFB8_9BACT|nr:hypothetical protein [Dyadobacter pollutisoli]WAC13089.1 hypothetical protein ON006_03810 [Dyadobacter pollutisoli]